MLEELLSLPVDKKVGQLFFIGLAGSEINDDSINLLKEISPGGVCLFSRNIKTAEQTFNLLNEVRKAVEIEPLLSLDEEGGTVDRLRRIVTPLPPANLIKTVENARTLARITAEIIGILGFNMNFAPVVDVVSSERVKSSNGLYTRAFGDSKESVAELTEAYVEALQAQNCFACLKHFPGLGASAVDSHEQLPSIDITAQEMFDTDLYPYKTLFARQKIHAVMVAHAAFPQIDLQETDSNGKLLPSSLSYNFITKLLREQLNFQKLVITDDLEMGAVIKNYGIGEACTRAVRAGADMPAICAGAENVRTGFYAVLDAVKSGEISESRIDESLRRIALIKNRLRKPIPFNVERLQTLSLEIAQLNAKLGYNYGG